MPNLPEDIKKCIKSAKLKRDGRYDPLAVSSLLDIEDEIKQAEALLNEFKNSKGYPEIISNAINYYGAIINKWDNEFAKKGDSAFCDRSEKQWYKDNKRDLKRLQKEAKMLKI